MNALEPVPLELVEDMVEFAAVMVKDGDGVTANRGTPESVTVTEATIPRTASRRYRFMAKTFLREAGTRPDQLDGTQIQRSGESERILRLILASVA